MAGTRTVGPGGWTNPVGTSYLDITITFLSASGTQTFTLDRLVNANSPCQVQSIVVGAGDNTINLQSIVGGVPKFAWCIIEPPPGNTQSFKVLGVTGETSITVLPAGYYLVTFNVTPPNTFIINAAGTISGMQLYLG